MEAPDWLTDVVKIKTTYWKIKKWKTDAQETSPYKQSTNELIPKVLKFSNFLCGPHTHHQSWAISRCRALTSSSIIRTQTKTDGLILGPALQWSPSQKHMWPVLWPSYMQTWSTMNRLMTMFFVHVRRMASLAGKENGMRHKKFNHIQNLLTPFSSINMQKQYSAQ